MQLLNRTTRASTVIERLMGDNILVTHYRRPEEYGSLVLPKTYEDDTSNTLWEIVQTNEVAEDAVGMRLPVGAVLTTLRRWPEDTNLVTPDGRNVFVLSIAAAGIRSITVYADAEE